ncbi:MAG: DUF3293 domain-containing protein [Gemmatimonadetes bacterium]|nr:DUF3293 domain-containing protein [Gemmatimonadota bacterium]
MPLHPAYFETRFRCESPAPDWPARFAIISASATTGERWDPAREAAADARLLATIRAHEVWYARVTGYSPTTAHAEPSWAVALARATACELGATFAQDAIYWVDGDALVVGRCTGDPAWEPVGAFRARVDAPG